MADTLEKELGTCAAETDAARRLGCYDRLWASLRPAASKPALPAAVPAVTTPSASAAPAIAAAPASLAPANALPISAAPPAIAAAPTNAQPPTSAATPPGNQKAAGSQTAEFGVSSGPLEAKRHASDAKSITGVVTNVAVQSYGILVVTLDNGQVWRQLQAEAYFPLKAGDTVEISRGALG